MANKIFALLNLDLLLTEYYKERLKFQLKNRKTDIKKHTLIELIEPLKLQLLTNWTFYKKSSSMKPSYPSFFIPPSLALSLPPLLNFSILFFFFYNHFYFYFDPKHKTSTSYSTGNLFSICAIKQLSKQKLEKKVTLADSTSSKAFLKDSSFASIPMYLHLVMPYPGLPGAPFFKKSNITDF